MVSLSKAIYPDARVFAKHKLRKTASLNKSAPRPCKVNNDTERPQLTISPIIYSFKRLAFTRTSGSCHGQESGDGTYTTTSDSQATVYVPVGLGGKDGLPHDSGPGGKAPELPNHGEPGGDAPMLAPVVFFAMMKAVSAPTRWKTVPTVSLKWQVPLL